MISDFTLSAPFHTPLNCVPMTDHLLNFLLVVVTRSGGVFGFKPE